MAKRTILAAIPLAFAAFVLIPTIAAAQQPSPAAPAAPAAPSPRPRAPSGAVAPPAAGIPAPTLLAQFDAWGAYTASPGGRKICFAIAQPATSETNPPKRPRDPIYAFISTRPNEKVREEVSIIIGYAFRANSEATVEIGGSNFSLYTQRDGAWTKNAADERRLLSAMRQGASMVVKGVSGRGTQTTDTFSLPGLAQALERIGQECR